MAAGARPSAASDADALAYAAVALTQTDADISAIACYTRSGRTARILSSLRPRVPILAFSPDPAVVRRLSLLHGVQPRSCVPPPSSDERLNLMGWLVAEDSTLPRGTGVVLVASTAEPGTGPNLLEVRRVG